MRINIAASHRFHLLDLARELAALGHDVRFYSYVPTKRAMKYGLKKENSKSLFLLMLPFLFLQKLSNNAEWVLKIKNGVLDYLLAWFMAPCDIYIALGTVYKHSFIAAKKRFNAISILEWGSKHILEQNAAINKTTDRKDYFVKRALDTYNIVDFISIPATHVKESFLKNGFLENQLLVNPYGVDLSMFYPTCLSSETQYDIIMVGNWSYTKGCDKIAKFCEEFPDYTFLHVGAIANFEFPTLINMTHVNPVDQSQLIEYYKMARVFLLPSRSEGFGMVLVQALACGLPIVCSKDTGGMDLRNVIVEKKMISILSSIDDISELKETMDYSLTLSRQQTQARNYQSDLSVFSWQRYGLDYAKSIMYFTN